MLPYCQYLDDINQCFKINIKWVEGVVHRKMNYEVNVGVIRSYDCGLLLKNRKAIG